MDIVCQASSVQQAQQSTHLAESLTPLRPYLTHVSLFHPQAKGFDTVSIFIFLSQQTFFQFFSIFIFPLHFQLFFNFQFFSNFHFSEPTNFFS